MAIAMKELDDSRLSTGIYIATDQIKSCGLNMSNKTIFNELVTEALARIMSNSNGVEDATEYEEVIKFLIAYENNSEQNRQIVPLFMMQFGTQEERTKAVRQFATDVNSCFSGRDFYDSNIKVLLKTVADGNLSIFFKNPAIFTETEL